MVIFNNSEFKTTVRKLGFVFLIGFLVLCLLCFLFLMQLNNGILRHDQIVTGVMLNNHPEAEFEIMSAFKNGSYESYQNSGAEVLKKYGYSLNMPYDNQPVLKGTFGAMVLYGLIFFVLFAAAVFYFLYRNYIALYGKVRFVANLSDNVVEGKFEYLAEQAEGDFAKLAHSFNRMAERVKAGFEKEKSEKEFLKNAVSDISHQIRMPLSSIMVFNELILETRDMEEDVRTDFINKNQTQLKRIQWLVESLLKMAMMESKSFAFEQNNVFVIDILEKSSAALYGIAKERGIILTVDSPENTVLCCDERWTVEACVNMIKNALEHTKAQGQVRVYSEISPLFVKIIIKDNGEGIDKRDMPHIFERFYKGGQSLGAGSVGIGLSLSKLIIEGQGGFINARSEKGKGTEFEIVFPSKR